MKTILYSIIFLLLVIVASTEFLHLRPSSESKAYGQMIIDTQYPAIKSDSVKAAILEKVHVPKTKNKEEQFLIVYKNVDGEIWKIENSLPFWGAGERNDSVWVFFSNESRKDGYVTFLNIKPVK
jgi:hypothetical protein